MKRFKERIKKVILVDEICSLPKMRQIIENECEQTKIVNEIFKKSEMICKGAILTTKKKEFINCDNSLYPDFG